MTDLCTNCRSKVVRERDSDKYLLQENYTDARLESDMQSMMLRMDQMQEMMAKLMQYLPNLFPSDDVAELPQMASFPPTPAKSDTSSQKSPVSELDDAETYIAEDLKVSSPVKVPLKRLPSVVLEQPIDSESISFISSENSQDTCVSEDMFHESFLEVAMKQMVGEEELDILSSIDNVYHMENLHQTFPILHQEELDAMEEQMMSNETYREQLMKELKVVRISMGVNCEFADILEKLMDRELLHFYNWYGNQGKKSLQRYKIFHQLLREITAPPNGKSFDDVMHRALTVSHRRKNNQVYRKKRKTDGYYK